MANVDAPNGFQPEYLMGGGGAIPLMSVLLSSNTGCKIGDPIALLTTGLATVGSATSTEILGVAQETVTAVAATRKNVKVAVALENAVFSGQCSGNCLITRIGEDVDIEGSTGIFEINEDASSIDIARIIGLKPVSGNAWGTNARVLFVWQKSAFSGRD